MTPQRQKSKRQALRFLAKSHPVRYKTEFDDGGAVIDNVSSGGCAMSGLDVELSPDEKILLLLEVNEEVIEIGARVIRMEEDAVAVQFTDIEEVSTSKLVKYFAQKQREANIS